MLPVSNDLMKFLSNRLKTGDKNVNIRVEVDKFVYTPNMTSDIEYIDFLANEGNPEIVSGTGNQYNYSNTNSIPNITSAAEFIYPIKGEQFNQNHVSSEFAVLSVNGKQRTLNGITKDHKGIDLAFGAGTKLVAVADGVVLRVQDNTSIGITYVDILHANDIRTRYLHVSNINVQVDTEVKQGQLVCEVSPITKYEKETGSSTGSHLHFEVRENSTKNQIGTPADPKEYFLRTKTIVNIEPYDINKDGYVTGNQVNFRESPSVGSIVIKQLSDNDFVTVHSRYGEWYYADAGADSGYIYAAYVNIDNSEGEDARAYSNPSYMEVINKITTECTKRGVPVRIGLATCWTETQMLHYDADGVVDNDNGGSIDWGIMQINDVAHAPYVDIQTIKDSWEANIEYAVGHLKYCYDEAKDNGFTEPDDIARSTYSIYNGGPSSFDRFKDNTDPFYGNDVNYWEYYRRKPWENYMPLGGSVKTLIVTSEGDLNVRQEPTTNSSILKKLKQGETVTYNYLQDSWYQVNLLEGFGYVHEDYVKVIYEPLNDLFERRVTFVEDFEKNTVGSAPTGFVQNVENGWVVGLEGSSNMVYTEGALLDDPYLQFTMYITHSGALNFIYKPNLNEDNEFLVFVNDVLVFNDTGTSGFFKSASIPLDEGTNIIKFKYNKLNTVSIGDKITIDNIEILNHIKRDKFKEYFGDVDLKVEDEVVAIGDDVKAYIDKDEASVLIDTLERGKQVKSNESDDEWVKVDTDNGEAYVKRNLVSVKKAKEKLKSIKFNTGGFIFDRTIVIEDIIDLNIDYKYGMRSATASLTVANKGNTKSPDYRPQDFPELGLDKSEYVDYFDGIADAVLNENTPIRIYIGYGNNLVRRFTGLIDNVSIQGDNEVMTITCTDMMKKMNNYVIYDDLKYPNDDDLEQRPWLVSSIIYDLARKAGLTNWKIKYDDLFRPDVVIEETYYTGLDPVNGTYIVVDENGEAEEKEITATTINDGYRNPWNAEMEIKRGTNIGDEIDIICQDLNYWQRCDAYGTYYVTPLEYGGDPVVYFKDTENILYLNKDIDYTRSKSHIVIVDDNSDEKHFLDTDLWRSVKGERRTIRLVVDWARSEGQKKAVADKLFSDMKMFSRTTQVAIEGNPYLELLDLINIEHANTTTKRDFVIKGMSDSWNASKGYITVLDLFWYEED